MASLNGEMAIEDALKCGKAILKFVAPNDVGKTKGHQSGYYLLKKGWQHFSPHPPKHGKNKKSNVEVTWQDGRTTNSVVTWYGASKDEYRLTKFGRGFPFLNPDLVGDLFVLVPWSLKKFSAYLLDIEEDIEEIQSALGLEIFDKGGAIYVQGAEPVEDEVGCVARKFREYVVSLTTFPTTVVFSQQTQAIVQACLKKFLTFTADDKLTELIRSEYELFQLAERMLCQKDVTRLFKDIDDFIKTAQRILQRRRSRAGWSLEHHFEYLLKQVGIPHDIRPSIPGEPDVVFPSRDAYMDPHFPDHKLVVLGLKTTCKDRWRQIMLEAPRVKDKHILTLQKGISAKQLDAMQAEHVTLVVPESLHTAYPKAYRKRLMTVESFLNKLQSTLQ